MDFSLLYIMMICLSSENIVATELNAKVEVRNITIIKQLLIKNIR